LQRIFIPYPEETEGAEKTEKAEKGKPATPSAEQVKAIAEKIHARAVAGEDFDKLQKDAFEAVGMKSTAPTTAMEKIPRGSLPAAQDAVFSLKPGAVSEVFSDPGAYYIYKVVSHETQPLDSVKDEIKKMLQNEKLQKSMEAIINSGKTELNDAYFAQGMGGPSRPAPPAVGGKLPPNKSPH
jgi:parvulin-like peptidyl-prolyl isomerase